MRGFGFLSVGALAALLAGGATCALLRDHPEVQGRGGGRGGPSGGVRSSRVRNVRRE